MKNLVFLLLLFLVSFNCFSTNYVAGDIVYKLITSPCSCEYQITLNLYVDGLDTLGAPDSVTIFTGDGVDVKVGKSDSLEMCNGTLKNSYSFSHTYPGQGIYLILFTDSLSFRSGVNYPNIAANPYTVSSLLGIDLFSLNENSVTFNNTPTLRANTSQEFRYNPIAIDVDGDSMLFELLDISIDFETYWIPSDMNINPLSGEVVWTNPDSIGKYEFTVQVSEIISGVIMGRTYQNFIIQVDSNNESGYFDSISNWDTNLGGYYEYKINPGDSLQLLFDYTDLSADSVSVISYGEVFTLGNPATFNSTSTSNKVNCNFNWVTDPSNVRNHPYIITFIAQSFTDTVCSSKYITVIIFVELPVSVSENRRTAEGIRVYPNPTTGQITLTNLPQKATRITIYNALGELVYDMELYGLNEPVINLVTFPDGMYLLQVETTQETVTKKFLIQNAQ